MSHLRIYFYELLSASFGLAILTFFGILTLMPTEIMLLGQEQSFLWVLVILPFCFFGGYILLTRFKQDYSLVIARLSEAVSLIFLALMIFTYLIFAQDMSEPWLMQVGWYLRYNGFITGLFLGATLIKTAAILTFLVSKSNQEEVPLNSNFLTLSLLALTSSFFIAELLLYRYFSFFVLLSLFGIIGVVLIACSVFLLTRSEYEENLRLPIVEFEVALSEDHQDNLKKSVILESNRERMRNSIVYLLIAIYGIFSTIILIIQVEIKIADWLLMLEQFLTYIFMGLVFLILQASVFHNRGAQRFQDYYKTKKNPISIGSLDGWKFLGLWLVTSQIVYFSDYPIYFPQVLTGVTLFGIIGFFSYWIVSKFSDKKVRKFQHLLYIAAIFCLVLNIILVYLDATTNAQLYPCCSYGDFDIIFPFLYLHSLLFYSLVGIPLGIVLSDFLLNFAFKHSDGSDSTNRSLFLCFIPFTWGMVSVSVNWYIGVPGGVPVYSYFTLFCVIFIIILLTGLGFHIITEILVPYRLNKKGKLKKRRIIKSNLSENKRLFSQNARKKVIAGLLIFIISFSSIAGILIAFFYKAGYSRPLVSYSPGNYYIWVQNSSERISKNFQISPEDSPILNEVEIFTAKNEYEAVQFVWRPCGKIIDSLEYEITDFVNQENLNQIVESEYCSLRYADYIVQDEFSDLLIPFESMDLKSNENYIFWFSLRTPYSVSAGKYNGQLKFSFNEGEKVAINISLNVWGFAVPDQRHLRVVMGPYTTDLNTISNFEKHRVSDNGVPISRATNLSELATVERYTCYLDKHSNNWEFNWTWWDNLTEYKLSLGMNIFFVQYPLGISEARVPITYNETKTLWMKKFYSAVQSHLESKDWLKYAYIYFVDEFNQFIPAGYTRQSYFKDLENLARSLNESAPKLKIFATVPPLAEYDYLEDDIDVYCPTTPFYDEEKWNALLDEGREFWFYACVGPTSPYPNSHLFNRLFEIRILIWQVWYYKIHGYLYWHTKGYCHGRYGFGFNGYGDGWFIYERNGKLYDSTRWENYLEGFEDYEYIWLLNASLNYLDSNPGSLSQQEINGYKSELQEIVNSITGDTWKYCDHPSTLYSGRKRIGKILHELSSMVPIQSISEAPWFPP